MKTIVYLLQLRHESGRVLQSWVFSTFEKAQERRATLAYSGETYSTLEPIELDNSLVL